MEQQVRGVLVERYVADLVDDDQLVAADLFQFGFGLPGIVSNVITGDAGGSGDNDSIVSGTAEEPSITLALGSAANTQLVDLIRQHDREAWGELIRRYGSAVRRTVARYRLNQSDSADAVQNTWLRAFEQIISVKDPERIEVWLTTTASREALQVVRARAVPGEPAEIKLEKFLAAADAGHVAKRALEQLPEKQRRLIILFEEGADQNVSKISLALGIPVGTIGPIRTSKAAIAARTAGWGRTQR